MARYARALGGFEKVRKLTILQARLLSDVIADEQMFQIKIHGCEVGGENKDEAVYTNFSDGFKAIQEALK